MKLWHVITAKIVITILFWCLPLLLGPKALFDWVGIPFPEPEVFIRLLGAAYAALVVDYYQGFLKAKTGGSAISTVRMGIVSNGLAAAILGRFGVMGAWADWDLLAQVYMWSSFIAAVLIPLGLVITGYVKVSGVSSELE